MSDLCGPLVNSFPVGPNVMYTQTCLWHLLVRGAQFESLLTRDLGVLNDIVYVSSCLRVGEGGELHATTLTT